MYIVNNVSMKKMYVIPALHTDEVEAEQMLALSLQVGDGEIADESEVLTKQQTDWNIWNEE